MFQMSSHELLKAQARQNRRSLNQEALAVFEVALATKKPDRLAEVADIIERNREAVPCADEPLSFR